MPRYIDADRLIERLKVSPIFHDFGMDGYFIRDMVIDLIECRPTAYVAPKSEVARLIEDFQRSIRADAKVGMSAGEILLHINNMLADLKKKYTEVENGTQ